jgi:hypothetical protein
MESLSMIENGSVRVINAYFRAKDESYKWPICGRFDATERAIRRLHLQGQGLQGLGYFQALEAEIGRIVHDAV